MKGTVLETLVARSLKLFLRYNAKVLNIAINIVVHPNRPNARNEMADTHVCSR